MTDRQRLVDQLILHESLRLKPYLDTKGKWKIGVGRNLTDKGITNGEAMMLLDHDLDESITDLASFPWFVSLDPVRQRVLIDLRLNLGADGFMGFKRALRMVSTGQYVLAGGAMRNSIWFEQGKSRGHRLVQMMVSGLDYTT